MQRPSHKIRELYQSLQKEMGVEIDVGLNPTASQDKIARKKTGGLISGLNGLKGIVTI